MAKTPAEINAERIGAIIDEHQSMELPIERRLIPPHPGGNQNLARKIVEAFPEELT